MILLNQTNIQYFGLCVQLVDGLLWGFYLFDNNFY